MRPVRLPQVLRTELKRVAKIMGRSDDQMIRLAAEIGLEHLRRIDYSLARAVVGIAEESEDPKIIQLIA